MSDDGGLTAVVTEEVTNQVRISDLLGDGDLVDEIDGGDLGAVVGRQFGERVGRAIGGAIGRELHETLDSEQDDSGRSELKSAVVGGVRNGLQSAIDDLGGREAIASLAETVSEGGSVEELLDRGESEDTADGDDGEDADDAETATAAEDKPDEESPDDSHDTDAPAADADTDRSADELADLKRETLEEFLGIMAYEDLQSIAKDVDVKANLSREEMTEQIIGTVSTADDEESTDGDSASDESTNEEPPAEAE